MKAFTSPVIVLALLVTGLLVLVVRFALRRRHERLTAADIAAWQSAYAAKGGARKVFSGYDQAQALKAKRAERSRFRRRFGRQKDSGAPRVVPFGRKVGSRS